jgi:hypothetical protein
MGAWNNPLSPDERTRATALKLCKRRTVREIVDAVEPQRTFYSLEPMPWSPPDSPDSYLELIGAVERRQFGVHLDPVNLVNSPAEVRRHVDAQRPRAARVVVVGVHEHVVDRAGGAGEQGHAPEEARQPPHVLILEVGLADHWCTRTASTAAMPRRSSGIRKLTRRSPVGFSSGTCGGSTGTG